MGSSPAHSHVICRYVPSLSGLHEDSTPHSYAYPATISSDTSCPESSQPSTRGSGWRPGTVATVSSASHPRPQCWDHGCNGRQFSTFSNLLRHQRERTGVASKSYCPRCGAEFTRATARNGHVAHVKCKPRRNSDI